MKNEYKQWQAAKISKAGRQISHFFVFIFYFGSSYMQ
jgi:hypothetical protein